MIRKKYWFLLGIIKQLLHDDVPDSPLGIRVGEAALTLNDAAAAPVRDELLDVKLICEVGFVVVTEPAVSDLPLGVGIHDDTLVVQDRNVLYISPSYENREYVGSTFFGTRRAFYSDFNLSSCEARVPWFGRLRSYS